jgi:hypothetical protein
VPIPRAEASTDLLAPIQAFSAALSLEAVEVVPFSTVTIDLVVTVGPGEVVAVQEVTPATDGLTTSPVTVLQTLVPVVVVVPETLTSINTPSMGEATAQEMVVPEVPEP